MMSPEMCVCIYCNILVPITAHLTLLKNFRMYFVTQACIKHEMEGFCLRLVAFRRLTKSDALCVDYIIVCV